MTIPIPSGMSRGRVSWRIGHDRAGSTLPGASGTVRFEPTARAVSYTDATVLPEPVETPVIGGVMTPVDLQVNDPEIWNWRVTPMVGVPWEPFHVDVPGPVDLATAVVVPGVGPVRAVKGVKGDTPTWGDLPGKPTTFPSTAHQHALADVDGLTAALAARMPIEALELNGEDLNTLAAPGVYVESGSAQVGANAPENEAFVLVVQANSARGHVWQTFTTYGDLGRTYRRAKYRDAWGAWLQQLDNTDSRLTDARNPTAHQHAVADVTGLADRLAVLEYDTGWRAFTPVGPHLTGEGKILFRRVGPAVYCRFEVVGVASTITRYSYITDAGFIPSGFRPEFSGRPIGLMSNSNANPTYAIGIAQGSRFRYQDTIGVTTLPGTGTQAITGQMQWSTLESRPSLTTLPGTPA